jgi:hypothetical protein
MGASDAAPTFEPLSHQVCPGRQQLEMGACGTNHCHASNLLKATTAAASLAQYIAGLLLVIDVVHSCSHESLL